MKLTRQPGLARLARAVATSLAVAAATAGSAAAAPLTYTHPSTGATVTFSAGTVEAGRSAGEPQRITFTGTGFVGLSPGPGRGFPLFAVKWDDNDVFPDWGPLDGSGKPDLATPGASIPGEPDVPAFAADAAGKISGWLELPAGIPTVGPEEAAPNGGRHWFRVLSGAFSTTATNPPDPGAINVTEPITAKAYVDARPAVSVGATNPAGAYFPGTVVTAIGPAQNLTVSGIGFPADAPVTVKVDGVAGDLVAKSFGTQTDLAADAAGDFKATVTLPAEPGFAGGTSAERTLTLTSGTFVRTVVLTRVAQEITVITPEVRPGGSLVVMVQGYRQISGRGQRVALVINPQTAQEQIIGCGDVDATGFGNIGGKVPAGQTLGSADIGVAGGTACKPADGITEPLGRGGRERVTVSATAPLLTSPFVNASPGGTVPISAEGYAPGEVVSVQYDGMLLETRLTASAAGTITGNVTVPEATLPGDHRILLGSLGATPAAAIIVKIVPAAKVTLTSSASVRRGDKVAFDVSGFVRGDGTAGQKVGVKVDAGAIVECVQADVKGDGTGTITIPADTEPGEHTLRFLAGSSCVSGSQDDLPSRSLAATIQVTALPTPVPTAVPTAAPQPTPAVVGPTPGPTPAPTPAPLPKAPSATKVKVTSKGSLVEITLAAAATGKRVNVGVKSASKIKLTSRAKAKTVTVAQTKTVTASKGKSPKVVLKLTADGKRILKARRALKIVVTIQLTGHATVTKTFTLKT